MVRRIFQSTGILYISMAILACIFCDFKQAKIQRLYELKRYYTDLKTGLNQNISKGKIRLLLRYYSLLAEIFPDRPRAHEMKGLCYVLLGKDDNAVESFTMSLNKRPAFFWVEFEKGRSLYRLHKWDRALKIFQNIESLSDRELFNACILSSFEYLPFEARSSFMSSLEKFVLNLKEYNHQMVLRCLLQKGSIEEAKKEITSTLQKPQLEFKQYFLLYGIILSHNHNIQEISWVQQDLEIERSLIGVHPWELFFPKITQPFSD